MKDMFKNALTTVAVASAIAFAAPAQADVMVGGRSMLPSMDIIDNAVNSADHTTLVAAVQAAGLVETLKGEGPFTVFAPTNAAFAELPDDTVETLLMDDHKDQLIGILTYHVVPGRLDSGALRQLVAANGGEVEIATVNGATLTVTANGPTNVVIADQHGNAANISTYDVIQSNGVIHVVDQVLLPN